MLYFRRSSLVYLILPSLIAQLASAVSLTLSTNEGNASSPLLYGFMIEDIDHSLDGGLHSQLLRNNGFQGKDPSLEAYAAVGNVVLGIDSINPVSKAITRSLKIDIPGGTTGQVGFSNEGYWGIEVREHTYNTSFWMKGSYSGNVTIKLVGVINGDEYASKTITVTSSDRSFQYFQTTLSARAASNGINVWTLTFDATKAAGKSLNFGLVQLYAPTYHSRWNGLKPELAAPLEDIKASFLRFPGGNNLEGASENDRWKWNETIGPLHTRPGRQGDWGYPNTDALGLMEYLYWCEDMKLVPVVSVWDGFALYHGGATPFTGTALEPYIDDVLNELEFILGDKSTPYGAIRARYGHHDPFRVKHVQIGNEDAHDSEGCRTYPERFTQFYNAIHKVYPDLILITSNPNPGCLPEHLPKGVWIDNHLYTHPDAMVKDFNYYDNLDRANPFVVLEYAISQYAPPNGTNIKWPYMQGSVAEAVYMIGMERNSDFVKMAAYAPLLAHLDYSTYTPNAISYRYSKSTIVFSTTYYVQKMFSSNRGDTISKLDSDTGFGPVYWVASKLENSSTYYVKLANYGADEQMLSVDIPGTLSGKLTVLSGGKDDYNSDLHPNTIEPTESDIKGEGGKFAFMLPAWSVAVIVLK
ncbi:glycoside hydrolase family 51 protein [Lepidopterella palustris CBS 459.81]|uniref:non-reducing end alpha-L-arabinofuranosidase n=1 Tax=Lepidopterella palustris CBS 459.81 TaxID=1314670 RepID=A0A8E2EB42_9PEZI|nr:glycoside hydrolase family 51 protein [Lepidopterella palustris CBS 459.81]